MPGSAGSCLTPRVLPSPGPTPLGALMGCLNLESPPHLISLLAGNIGPVQA